MDDGLKLLTIIALIFISIPAKAETLFTQTEDGRVSLVRHLSRHECESALEHIHKHMPVYEAYERMEQCSKANDKNHTTNNCHTMWAWDKDDIKEAECLK